MAGIIKRFSDIMSANINALLDKAEDPAKMIDQYLRNLESDLGNVKAETAAIMAEETRSKRELDECIGEVEKMQKYAEKAVIAGNDADAKTFLTKKGQLVEKQNDLLKVYEAAAANASKMRTMHDKLVSDITDLNSRKDTIKAKLAVAKTQEKLNNIGSSVLGAQNSMSAFDKMEAKADKMLDQANAMAELNESKEDDTKDLMGKYDRQTDSGVEDELAALKSKMGL
ncbi:MAG: PspA/IM30 family protein [Lachnotalea sp.]